VHDNLARGHRGYHLNGRTPARALREALGTSAKKLLSVRFKTEPANALPTRHHSNDRRPLPTPPTPKFAAHQWPCREKVLNQNSGGRTVVARKTQQDGTPSRVVCEPVPHIDRNSDAPNL
jgi:hypothetical protein